MNSEIFLNEYIKADIVSDILSQNIAEARKKVNTEHSEEAKHLLEKLLKYSREFQRGNNEVIDKILNGEV